jgi:uncharacterized protein
MGHGLGGTKEMGLDRYARRFREAGFAVLVFDYRYFGDSGGEPSHLIWIPDQLDDWAAAIEYARSRPEVDPAQIGLWGTSLSGGHVITTAAKDARIGAVSAQCPALDGMAAAQEAMHHSGISAGYLRLIVHAQRDLVRSWLGLSPHRVPVVGPAGSVALMALPAAVETFAALAPADYENEACARIAIRADKYQPVKGAQAIQCPVLLQICEDDSVTPPAVVAEMERRLGNRVEVIRYPIGHFDIYRGEHFEQAVGDQLRFFVAALSPASVQI